MKSGAKKWFLAIEGNIGAGKSTFLRLVATTLNAQVIYEPLQQWQNIGNENFFDYYYKDPQRWAYAFQTYAVLTRIRAQQRAGDKKDIALHILERSVYSDRYCFAQTCYELGFLKKLEWTLYQEWFDWCIEQYTFQPDAFIYLRTAPEICFQRLVKRNRSEEVGVTKEYLQLIHQKHEDWLIHKKDLSANLSPVPTLALACDEDFEHNKYIWDSHIRTIREFLDAQFKIPTYTTNASTITVKG